MTEVDLNQLSPQVIGYDLTDVENRLLPLLRQDYFPKKKNELKVWLDKMLQELRSALQILLPLEQKEIEFIQTIREEGEIKPELITDDHELIKRIKSHPAILWSAKKTKANLTT